MKTIRNIFLVAVVTLFSSTLFAQGDILSAADFMKLYKTDKNLVIIDASKAENYNKVHIKNAINLPHGDLYQIAEIDGLIETPEKLAKILGDHGVSETNTIVLTDGGSQKYSCRIYWILKYLGTPNVKILHKDMIAFKKARVPLTSVPAKRKPVTFNYSVDKSVIANIDEVKSGKYTLIDARTPEEYNGTADNSDGHLPGAVNINYTEFLNDKNAFKSKEEMEKLVSRYGITANTPVIAYCRTSVRAAVIFVAFKNVLGYNNIKVYDGAYLEWVYKNNAVNTKAKVSTQKSAKTGSGGGC